jgi:hypothetical protein
MLTWLKPKHCSACEEPMPAHALINFEGDLFCVRCIKPMDKERIIVRVAVSHFHYII